MTFRDFWVENPIYVYEIEEETHEQKQIDAEDYFDSLNVEYKENND